MRAAQSKRFYRARNIAIFIAEGHTLTETEEEFSLGATAIRSHLYFLANEGYGEELKKNRQLYLEAKRQLEKNRGRG